MRRVLCIALALTLAGGGSPRNVANLLMRAQTPGSATDAGATLIGPGNSAAPSTQESERTGWSISMTWYRRRKRRRRI